METMMDYDILILGSGPGGYVAAIRAAQLGAKVAVIEEREIGGVCLNRGCIPTKALVESTRAYQTAQHGEEFGFKVSEVTLDYPAMLKRMEEVVGRLRRGVEGLLKKNKVEVIAGRGALTDRNTIEVTAGETKTKVTAHYIILATGSAPLRLPGFPYDGKVVLTSDDALKLDHVPGSVLIVGGGYIGAEWASIYRSLGAEVTVVEMMNQLLPRSDTDLAKELFRWFKKQKIGIHLETKVESVEVKGDKAVCALSNGKSVEVDKVLVCVGRSLNTKEIGLEAAGIRTERGVVVIDDYCRTSVPNVFAIGDISGKLMLAHVASHQALAAAANAMGEKKKVSYRVVPACVFSHLEIGSVGLSTAECAEKGIEVKESRFPFSALGKAIAAGETNGWAKIIADAKTGEVLGVHIIGPHASDLIAEAALAMSLEATVEEIAHSIHAHPTLPEALMEAAEGWLGHGIHG
jgi:dihydrolipoamide dehydrogenase